MGQVKLNTGAITEDERQEADDQAYKAWPGLPFEFSCGRKGVHDDKDQNQR